MSVLLTIKVFVGRLHPVLVHLPIGILLLAAIFYFLRRKNEQLNVAVKYALLIGFFAGVLSCITGYLLSMDGGYENSIVSKHQWLGIATTITAGIVYYLYNIKASLVKWLLPLMLVLLIITGHLGGTLTHGENYLFASDNKQQGSTIKPIPDVQQAIAYTDIIKPILQTKCYSCHSSSRQKGKLRLDEPAFIQKGGESGNTILAGNADESELIKRILLPESDDDHMPPAKKPQLTKTQIELLHWWIQQGADFSSKTAALKQPEKIKPYLLSLQNGKIVWEEAAANSIVLPEKQVDKAPESILKQLRDMDVSIVPVARQSNYLSVSFAAVDTVTSAHLDLLKKLSEQVIWLKLSGTKVKDDEMAAIGELKSLTRLSLDKTGLTDRGIAVINGLTMLEYLNLSFTSITGEGLGRLNGLKKLKQLHLYQTRCKAGDLELVQKLFPGAKVDTGGYRLAYLPTDTIIKKAIK